MSDIKRAAGAFKGLQDSVKRTVANMEAECNDAKTQFEDTANKASNVVKGMKSEMAEFNSLLSEVSNFPPLESEE